MFQQNTALPLDARAAPLEPTVVIPTLNEAGNVEPLLARLGLSLAGIDKWSGS